MDANQTANIVVTAINAGTELITLLLKLANDLQQNKELSPDQEKALDDAIAGLKTKPWWTPDSA